MDIEIFSILLELFLALKIIIIMYIYIKNKIKIGPTLRCWKYNMVSVRSTRTLRTALPHSLSLSQTHTRTLHRFQSLSLCSAVLFNINSLARRRKLKEVLQLLTWIAQMELNCGKEEEVGATEKGYGKPRIQCLRHWNAASVITWKWKLYIYIKLDYKKIRV